MLGMIAWSASAARLFLPNPATRPSPTSSFSTTVLLKADYLISVLPGVAGDARHRQCGGLCGDAHGLAFHQRPARRDQDREGRDRGAAESAAWPALISTCSSASRSIPRRLCGTCPTCWSSPHISEPFARPERGDLRHLPRQPRALPRGARPVQRRRQSRLIKLVAAFLALEVGGLAFARMTSPSGRWALRGRSRDRMRVAFGFWPPHCIDALPRQHEARHDDDGRLGVRPGHGRVFDGRRRPRRRRTAVPRL